MTELKLLIMEPGYFWLMQWFRKVQTERKHVQKFFHFPEKILLLVIAQKFSYSFSKHITRTGSKILYSFIFFGKTFFLYLLVKTSTMESKRCLYSFEKKQFVEIKKWFLILVQNKLISTNWKICYTYPKKTIFS